MGKVGARQSSAQPRGCFLQAFAFPAPFPPIQTTRSHDSSGLWRSPGLPDPPAPSCGLTWKTLAAETRQARAEERVAPKMPAVIRGAKPDTMLIVCRDMRFRPLR